VPKICGISDLQPTGRGKICFLKRVNTYSGLWGNCILKGMDNMTTSPKMNRYFRENQKIEKRKSYAIIIMDERELPNLLL